MTVAPTHRCRHDGRRFRGSFRYQARQQGCEHALRERAAAAVRAAWQAEEDRRRAEERRRREEAGPRRRIPPVLALTLMASALIDVGRERGRR